ncbi:hypothetical protein [Thermosporothrix hazakensis]|uniref:Uncharacterized protein n=1 Tax=Thermosporothrix sp. COM3 TaxID=2490863 RepID=A0A455SF38_9CHLR|nr:hypothetical protein [Thermosporothrix hazakensis]BBH85629.1 hypothetical protein KTC_03800 [Thermosporothrix sp. COM3]GCE45942.1 hypothetical protein KTH_08110 [Thermosporothrix hazakensis]
MTQGEKNWSGGGGSAIDSIWQVRGVDGHTYYVDRTGTVYTEQQIPLDPAFPTFS